MRNGVAAIALSLLGVLPEAHAATDLAAAFGRRETVEDISLSPDGSKLAFIQPAPGKQSVLFVVDVKDGTPKPIFRSDGKPWEMSWCAWASNTRLICRYYGIFESDTEKLAATRFVALNSDGTNVKQLGQRSSRMLNIQQFDGSIIGWPVNDDGAVLMAREYTPENTTDTRIASRADGLGVDLINSQTLKAERVEPAKSDAARYIADGQGKVRIMQLEDRDGKGQLRGTDRYFYRTPETDDWLEFSTAAGDGKALVPVAVDSANNVAYAFRDKDGRSAVYTVSLDGKMTEKLVLANDKVDVSNLVRFGRSGRIIGAQVVTDKRETVLFDAGYKTLVGRLSKALPGLPLIKVVDASRDENRLLMFAGSDVDPGRYYMYDKTSKQLNEVALARPDLEGVPLSQVKMVQYPAADGTLIPAYLTLPPGSDGKSLPAIVMPHGGPSARDEWGFDWMAQYFASQGYAVLQPNFRGSAGYGDDWYVENGFKSWRVAVGDVNDAGRWLVSQGTADASKLAVVGWSYGGYAALQSSVLDEKLFNAIVAIAPVTDLKMLIEQSRGFTNANLVANFVGSGEHIVSGSPLQQAAKIKSPVLMFSGDWDLNVDIAHSKAMEAALRKQGTPVELVTYKALDHQLEDSAARSDMLRKSAEFLKKNLKLP